MSDRADRLLSQGPRRLAELRGRVYRKLMPEVFGYRMRIGRGLSLDNPRAMRLGKGVILHDGVMLLCRPTEPGSPPLLTIGAKTFLNRGACVAAGRSVSIGEDVLLGPGALVVDEDHVFDRADLPIARQGTRSRGPIVIGDGSWLAAHSVVLGGTVLAAGSVVAAGAVVRGTYDRRCLLAGTPARVVRYLDDDGAAPPADEPAPGASSG